jgi:hypothetical protein
MKPLAGIFEFAQSAIARAMIIEIGIVENA